MSVECEELSGLDAQVLGRGPSCARKRARRDRRVIMREDAVATGFDPDVHLVCGFGDEEPSTHSAALAVTFTAARP